MTLPLGILLAVFFGLGLLRVPIGLAMLAGGFAYLLAKGSDPGVATEQVMNALHQSSVLLAIPMFIFAANIMNAGTISERLLDFALALVGRVRGGLGHVNVVVNVIFASMSGSAVADAAGPGAVLIRMMTRDDRYPAGFAAALTASAATLAPIIPPSIPMILYAVIANVSVGALFAAGVMPGLLMAAILMAGVAFVAHRRQFPKEARIAWREFPRIIGRSLLALALPVVILGGMRIGAFTPTEGAAVAALYALILAAIVYRALSPAKFREIVAVSLAQSTAVMVIISGAFLINYALTAEQVPLHIAAWFADRQFGANQFLVVVMLLFLVLGCFVDTTVMLLVLVPVLLPTARTLGIDLVHFGVIVIVNMMVGMLTPPYGVLLFVVNAVTGIPLKAIIDEIWFFCGLLVIALFLMVFIPDIVLWLPRALAFKTG